MKRNESGAEFVSFRSSLSVLSYLCKAPIVPSGTPVINSLFRQRAAIENILRACVGLPPNSHIALEHRVSESNNENVQIDRVQVDHIILIKIIIFKLIFFPQFENLIIKNNDQPPIKKMKKCTISAVNGTSN